MRCTSKVCVEISRVFFQEFQFRFIVFAVILLVCTIVTAVSSRRMKKDPCHGLPDDTFIANSKGCKYFFCCKNGIGVSAYCPHGLWFNAKNSVCDLPHEVDCHLDDPVTTTTTTTTVKPTQEPGSTIETTTSSATTTTTQLPIIDADQDEIVCPPHDANTVQFVGSKINCRHFYICYHGRAVRQECGEGLHWSAKTKQCAAVADAGCKVSVLAIVANAVAATDNDYLELFLTDFVCVCLCL